MATPHALTKEETYVIADSLAQASSLVLDLRIRQRATLSQEEQQLLEKHENHLDMLVSLFRAYGIYLITEDAQQASSELLQAIDKGKARLKRINDIKAGIETAARLVDLGHAVVDDLHVEIGGRERHRIAVRRQQHIGQDRDGVATLHHALHMAQSLQQSRPFNGQVHRSIRPPVRSAARIAAAFPPICDGAGTVAEMAAWERVRGAPEPRNRG